MIHRMTERWEAKGFRHGRNWFLADNISNVKSDNDTPSPSWVGWLTVIFPSAEAISRFRLQDLSPDHVCSASAWNTRGDLIYHFNCRVSGKDYNCIYDDKPLDGRWPWPKKGQEGKDGEGDGDGEGEGGGSRVFRPPGRVFGGRMSFLDTFRLRRATAAGPRSRMGTCTVRFTTRVYRMGRRTCTTSGDRKGHHRWLVNLMVRAALYCKSQRTLARLGLGRVFGGVHLRAGIEIILLRSQTLCKPRSSKRNQPTREGRDKKAFVL